MTQSRTLSSQEGWDLRGGQSMAGVWVGVQGGLDGVGG